MFRTALHRQQPQPQPQPQQQQQQQQQQQNHFKTCGLPETSGWVVLGVLYKYIVYIYIKYDIFFQIRFFNYNIAYILSPILQYCYKKIVFGKILEGAPPSKSALGAQLVIHHFRPN